jgi:hypothetical protein
MMVPTQQNPVVEVGRTVIKPAEDVMTLTPGKRIFGRMLCRVWSERHRAVRRPGYAGWPLRVPFIRAQKFTVHVIGIWLPTSQRRLDPASKTSTAP